MHGEAMFLKNKKTILTFALIVLACCALFVVLVFTKAIKINRPSLDQYPVVGVDVSAYQGSIDWPLLAEQGIQFAFIKATEGSSFVDRNFTYNYENAFNTDLRVGAYHFFSYDSAGKTQAENFIANVQKKDNMLPPVIDIEFYGDKAINLPEKEATQRELDVLIAMLKDHYGLNPIIYATHRSYRLYIAGRYTQNDIWIRSVYHQPNISDKRDWIFWQYTDTAKLAGYKGEEQYIDVNVFRGSQEEFDAYID